MPKYDIIVHTMVNDQPDHVFIQHHGIKEAKVADLFREVVQEQYDRLERGRPTFGVDTEREDAPPDTPFQVVMSRLFEDGAITSVNVFASRAGTYNHFWIEQEANRKGEHLEGA
jgi:hypothetical protein